MPSIAQLGHVALVTPNLEKSLWYMRDVLGMEVVAEEGDKLYLRCYQELEHHSLVLSEGPEAVCEHVGWRVGAPEDVQAYAEQLRAAGVDVTEHDGGPGHGESIRFHTPGGEHPFELFYDVERPATKGPERSLVPSNSRPRTGLGPRRIDHVNLWTSADTVASTEQWMSEQLGFKRREYVQPTGAPLVASWMSVTPQVHDVAVMTDFGTNSPGRFHHVAFNMECFSDVLTAADHLRDRGVQIDLGPGKHGIGQAMFLYTRDPGSGHRIELYAGGYFIFAPDWEPILWNEENMDTGLVYYGPPFSPDPSHPMTPTTACARQEVSA
jgi:catechol 2,3-dioxygenase